MKKAKTGTRTNEQMKKDLWKKLEKIYRDSIRSVKNILKHAKTFHLYEDKDGWDDTPQPVTGCVSREMTPEEIFMWMYENDINPRSIRSPHIYTDDEISSFRKNRSFVKIADWKKSIEFHREQIKKYELRIEDAENQFKR